MTSPRAAILGLLDRRKDGATICPSEAARALGGGENWRGRMPAVHEAVDGLLADGTVALTWKGERMARRDGPYRIVKRQT